MKFFQRVKSLSGQLFLIATSCFATSVSAGECHIELEHGLIITPEHIRVMDKNRTVLQINNDEQLFIQGYWKQLSEPEQLLLRQFSEGLRREVPEIVDIAMDGVSLGIDAINQIIDGVSGGSAPLIKRQFEEIKFRFKERFNHTDDIFYIAPQSLDEIDDFFEDELSEKIKAVVSESLGAILIALSEALSSAETNYEINHDDFGERMEKLSKQIDIKLSEKSTVLEAKAQLFCEHLKELDEIETALQKSVPELHRFDIVRSKD